LQKLASSNLSASSSDEDLNRMTDANDVKARLKLNVEAAQRMTGRALNDPRIGVGAAASNGSQGARPKLQGVGRGYSNK